MGLGGALRNIIRPLAARRLILHNLPLHREILSPLPSCSSRCLQPSVFFSPIYKCSGAFFSTSTAGTVFSSLTDTRFPKRRPGMKSRRKRASLKPRGKPIPSSRPNEGSVKGRNQIKRIVQRKAFMLSEKKKGKAQYAEFRKKRDMMRRWLRWRGRKLGLND